MENFLQTAFDDDGLRLISWMRFNFSELDSLWRLVDVIYRCARKWGGVICESALLAVEEAVVTLSLNFQIFEYSFEEIENNLEKGLHHLEYKTVNAFRVEILRSISQAMMELCKVLSDGSTLLGSNSSQVELEEALVNFDWVFPIWFVVSEPEQNTTFQHRVSMFENLKEDMRFLKNLVCFAGFQGLDQHSQMMGDLLAQVQGLVFHIAGYIFEQFLHFDCGRDDSGYNQLMVRIETVRSNVCRIYIGAMQEASKLSEWSNHLSDASHTLLLVDFVDSLLFLLSKLLFHGTNSAFMFRHQMLKVHEGLRFLRNHLREYRDKIDKLYEKLQEHIESFISEAGIIIFSLFLEKEEEEGLVGKLELLFSELDRRFEFIKAAAEEEEALIFQLTLASHVPQTNLLGFIDSVLEKMKCFDLHETSDSTVTLKKDEFLSFHDSLEFIRSFLVDVVRQCGEIEKLQSFWSCIAAVAYETEYVLDSMVVGKALWSFVVPLNNIMEDIKLIKTKTSDIFHRIGQITKVQNRTKSDQSKIQSSSSDKIVRFDEVVVGLDDESETIIDRLRRGTKNLDVISIVGMAGLGKTTLVKKVYGHFSILLHFDSRSWCTVSQVYNKRNLFLEILNCLKIDSTNKFSQMSIDDLADVLRKSLKGKRYLLVLDDVWDTEVWSILGNSFPNDNKGSRIILTSRDENVALQTKPCSHEPYRLRNLTNDESWELFQKKICFKEGCPLELIERGKAIAQRCKGLPLMILIVVGILSNMEPASWEEVEESLNKGAASITNQCTETLELSYRHLPEYLKPCFLYIGAYGEDQQIRVRDLLRRWIAEGFIVDKNGTEGVENVADGYMVELIKRNLVMIDQKGSTGKVKYCILHDLLHNFCKVKANKEYLLHGFNSHDELGNSTESDMVYRLSVNYSRAEDFAEWRMIYPRLRTLSLTAVLEEDPDDPGPWKDIMFKFLQSKLLRVLVLSQFLEFPVLPNFIQLLVQLKYLALKACGSQFFIPPSFGNLSNLESFIVYGSRRTHIYLPKTLGNMTKLRNLYTRGGAQWILPSKNPNCLSSLQNLQYLSTARFLSLQTMVDVLRNFANIQKLKCYPKLDTEQHVNLEIVRLDFLSQLESLGIIGNCLHHLFLLPQNLKRLTLSDLVLPWSEISAIYRLPNLEVLKLCNSFTLGSWEMPEEVETFPNLRYLRFYNMTLQKWTASNDNFPCLQRLVLSWCTRLVELPYCLAESSTLEMIELFQCDAAAHSIKRIQDMKEEWGNEGLKILIR